MAGTKRPLLSRVRVILGGRSSRSVIGRPGGSPTAVVPASIAGRPEGRVRTIVLISRRRSAERLAAGARTGADRGSGELPNGLPSRRSTCAPCRRPAGRSGLDREREVYHLDRCRG